MEKVRYNIEVPEDLHNRVSLYAMSKGFVKPGGKANSSAVALHLIGEGLRVHEYEEKIAELQSALDEANSGRNLPALSGHGNTALEYAASLAGINTDRPQDIMRSAFEIAINSRDLEGAKKTIERLERENDELKAREKEYERKTSTKENIKEVIETVKPMLPALGAILQGKPIGQALGEAGEQPHETSEAQDFGEAVYDRFKDDVHKIHAAVKIFSDYPQVLDMFLEQSQKTQQ